MRVAIIGAGSSGINTWLATCALADAGDVFATLAGRNSIPSRGVRTTVAAATLGAIGGLALIALNSSDD